jgi:hypothetical protein
MAKLTEEEFIELVRKVEEAKDRLVQDECTCNQCLQDRAFVREFQWEYE